MAAPRFLLDEHISPSVAAGLAKRGVTAMAIVGSLLEGLRDDRVFRWAYTEGWIVVTYNVRHFAPLLAARGPDAAPPPGAGVVFVRDDVIRNDEIGPLVRSLAELAARIEANEADAAFGWFLQRAD